MASLFLSYLLGVCLLLGQFPDETSAGSLKQQSRSICDSKLYKHIEKVCSATRHRDSSVREEITLPEGSLSGVPVIFSHRDTEALKTLLKFIPEMPPDLKASLSDSEISLRKLRHPKDRGIILDILAKICCLFDCLTKAKDLLCST